MRRDVTELKKLVHDIMSERAGTQVSHPAQTSSVQYIQEAPVSMIPETPVVMTPVPVVKTSVPLVNNYPVNRTETPVEEPDVQDTEEYIEENLSLDEVEKEMIRKALERHHGKRKNAAKDLKISERTLYRKIKEYGLD